MAEAVVGQYRQRPLAVTAIRWEPELGVGHGVRARPKKHDANPDEFYVRDRFGKEFTIRPGEWVLTYPDGSHAILAEGTFQALYEPEGDAAPSGATRAAVGSGGTNAPETGQGTGESLPGAPGA